MLGIGLLILRLGVGLTVAAHGSQKLFGWFNGPRISGFGGMLEKMGVRPGNFWAVGAGLAEFAGGLAVALGLLTPLAALAVVGNMIVAIVLVHLAKGFWSQNGGYEYPLTLAVAALAISLTGPGAYSLDRLLRINLPEPATWWIVAVVVALAVVGALGARLAGQRRPVLG